MKRTVFFCLVAAACISSLFIGTSAAMAASTKIGVIDATKVVSESTAGKKAQQAIQAKKEELEKGLRVYNDEFIALQSEFQKKSSAWTETVKKDKEIELKQKGRDVKIKQDDANLALNKFREEKMGPVVKTLQDIIPKVAQKNKVDVVLDRHVVAYMSEDADLTDEMIKALNKAMK